MAREDDRVRPAVKDLLEFVANMQRRAEDLLRRLRCANCGLFSGEEARGWRTYLTDDEPPVAEHFCPDCAAEEFGDARSGR